MKACVVIPTLNGREMLVEALASLQAQTRPAHVVVVDNGSTDGAPEMVTAQFPAVQLVSNQANLGFGKAVNRGVAAAPADVEVIVLVNNDAVCGTDFVERIVDPFADPGIGMVAGVLLQGSAPGLVDSAGIELDVTLRSYDALWNADLAAVAQARVPVGPCGGAAAYRATAFAAVGGFEPAFFAYWEDVDLALRLRLSGWRCAFAPDARALHLHGQTLGANSPAVRTLDAFGRGFVLGRFRERDGGAPAFLRARVATAIVDWPALIAHLVVRREMAPLRARARGLRAGRALPALRAPVELATVSVREAVSRQWSFLGLRLAGEAPRHFDETDGAADRG